MKLTVCAAAAAAIAIATPTLAQERWLRVTRGTDNSVFFIDVTTFIETPDGIDVWVDQRNGVGIGHLLQQWSYRCKERQSTVLSTTRYSDTGSVVFSKSQRKSVAEYTPVVPDTVVETIMGLLCKP